jgi:hypothetical protein
MNFSGWGHPALWSVTAGSVTSSGTPKGSNVSASTDAWFPLRDLPPGGRLQALILNSAVSGAGVITQALYKAAIGGSTTAITGATSTAHSNPLTLTPNAPAVLADGETYWLRVTTDASVSTILTSYSITFDVP